MSRIVTLTLNPSIDESTSVDRVVPEDKLRCEAPSREPGGGGINVSRALRHFGTDSLALWTKGGTTGTLMHELLDAEGVQHQPIEIGGMTRQNFTAYESSSALQYRFVMPGPVLTPACQSEILQQVGAISPAPDFLVLSGSLPPGPAAGFYAEIIARIDRSTRIILDTSGPSLAAALQAGVYLCKPNIGELASLAGAPLTGDKEIEAAARRLVEQAGAEIVVVSLGAGGVMAVTREASEHVRSPTVPVRSKVGAGDSMVAGFVHALSEGRPLPEVIRFGVAAGAAAVMTEGSRLCTREDAERLFRGMR